MKTNVQHYIRLTVSKKLDNKDLRKWYAINKENLSSGLITTQQVINNDETKDAKIIIHKNVKTYDYYIPLTRHLEENEVTNVIHEWDEYFKPNFIIEISSEIIQKDEDEDNVLIDSDAYNDFAEKVAKRMHTKWYDEKLDQGWRYGVKFDQKNKTNPMLKPWNELSEEYKYVDPELPQMFFDMVKEEGYVILTKNEFANLVEKSLSV